LFTENSHGTGEKIKYTVKMNMLYLIIRIVATDYKQYY